MARIVQSETIIKYVSLVTSLIWLAFVGYSSWKFLKLDPYNTKVITTLLITSPVIFLGTLAIFFHNSNKHGI